MKKFFKFITIVVLFLVSLSVFGVVTNLIGKLGKSNMAKVA